MKIKFLGCSHGVPEPDRFCSSTMIDVEGSLYLIDAGAPIIDLIRRAGRHPSEVKGIFITHCHGDHLNGLIHFLDICGWYFGDTSLDIFIPEMKAAELIVPYVEFLKVGEFNHDRFRFHLTEVGEIFSDERVKITARRTYHMGDSRPSFSYQVEAEGKSVIFTGDLSGGIRRDDFRGVAYFPSDLVVCEMAHFGPETIEQYLPDLPTKALWFNHVNSDYNFAGIAAMDGKYKFPVKAARDGDEIIL